MKLTDKQLKRQKKSTLICYIRALERDVDRYAKTLDRIVGKLAKRE